MNRPIAGLPLFAILTLISAAPALAIDRAAVPAALPGFRLPLAAAGPRDAMVPTLPAASIKTVRDLVGPDVITGLPAKGATTAESAGVILQNLGGSIEMSAPSANLEDVQFGAAYDGSNGSGNGGVPPSGGDGNGSGDGNGRRDGGDNGGLGKLYPRVVMILDTLEGPASDKLVARIETLLDQKVHVVFVTARPEKGANSAESVLVSRIKVRSGNPLIVVSANGARIAARSSRAENPKGVVEDVPGFAENTIEMFGKINAALKSKVGSRTKLREFGIPSLESAHLYGVELPEKADAKEAASFYNKAMSAGGYKYRFEAGEDADGRKFLFTQSTALKLNTERVFQAITAVFPHMQAGSPQSLKPSEVLILADSTRASGFLKSLPGKGYYIHGVKDAAGIENALDAVLGTASLEKVSVVRSKLRAYTEWLEARAKYGAPRKAGGSFTPGKNGRYYRELGFYRGIIMYDIMGRLYHRMRKGQWTEASPEAAEDLLRQMWNNPIGNGVRISEEMEATLRQMRRRPAGRQVMNGYFDAARTYLRNYYKRNFGDYPVGQSQKVMGTLINLARDTKNSVSLEYAAPYTGRRYIVHLLPARAHLERDEKGNLLVAHVYRTGKEPYEEEFEENIEVNLLARAMLQGYADKREDGRWYVNDEPDPRVKVVFHYMTRDLPKTQTTAEIESHSGEVTALIEKMNADKEFLAHWEEQEAKNNKTATGLAKAKAAREARKAKTQTKGK